jgi:hypothetical protein
MRAPHVLYNASRIHVDQESAAHLRQAVIHLLSSHGSKIVNVIVLFHYSSNLSSLCSCSHS